jgi:CBS domain-containing protein
LLSSETDLLGGSVRVSELMVRSVRTARIGEAVDEVRARFEGDDIGHFPVVDSEGRIVGMLSDSDLPRASALPSTPKLVEEIMARPVHAVGVDTSTAEAAQLMLDCEIDAVPVVANGALVGILTATDFVRLLRESSARTPRLATRN